THASVDASPQPLSRGIICFLLNALAQGGEFLTLRKSVSMVRAALRAAKKPGNLDDADVDQCPTTRAKRSGTHHLRKLPSLRGSRVSVSGGTKPVQPARRKQTRSDRRPMLRGSPAASGSPPS